jgi:hypothetical protein
MNLFEQSAQQILGAIFGFYGTAPISGTTEKAIRCHAYEANVDSVIESVKDQNNQERITDIGWSDETIYAGKTVYFGFEANKITLASGHGQVYRTQAPF